MINDLIKSMVKSIIDVNENYFEVYLQEHKFEILAELLKSGKYVIKSPYGLTATITAEKKEDSEKLT